jgi:hypothetical protein
MSPSEFDLRAALRAGEGQRVNADGVIANAREVRHNRRKRVVAVVGAAAVVAGIGTGISYLPGTSSSDSASSGGGLSTAKLGNSRGAPQADLTACPRTPPHLVLPGGGGTTQFGATGPLFAEPVEQIVACGYGMSALGSAAGLGGTVTISGADAQQVADSLNDAPARRAAGQKCPAIVQPLRELVLYATGTSGAGLRPVVATFSTCPAVATNGTAVRYDWTPPASWAASLNAIMVPKGTPQVVRPTGHPSGSPLH